MVLIDYPSEKRVHLPVDFGGPICAKCTWVVIPPPTDDLPVNGHNWECGGVERQVIAPAETNPVTGKVHEARYGSRPLCKVQNASGDCGQFSPS